MKDHREITGTAFVKHLEEIGILRPGSDARRVIIDVAYDTKKVMVYSEGPDIINQQIRFAGPDVSDMVVTAHEMLLLEEAEEDNRA